MISSSNWLYRIPLPLAIIASISSGIEASAVAIDFTTFAWESFPHADNNNTTSADPYPLADWTVTSSTATHKPNATPSILYSPWGALNKRISGTLNGKDDDDILGFVIGFSPGNATLGDPSAADADYLIVDWKGFGQSNNFFDFALPGFTAFHNLTGITTSSEGLVLSKVQGIPTADELWGRIDLPQNSLGGVTELSRANSFASTGYATDTQYELTVDFTPTRLIISIDGVEQFNHPGKFVDGRFGFYTSAQGVTSGPVFSNFTTDEIPSGDFDYDFDVDGNDFLIWQREFGNVGANAADADESGDVGTGDLFVWKSSFGVNASPQSISIPEASSRMLMTFCIGCATAVARVKMSRRARY
ncbi:hypothetical protein [Lacipirellula sp.]|uniref:hypothetical protein n=1 Tax=Lacipirellula sp. TaxID=2691419 RepID=UPI003D14943C